MRKLPEVEEAKALMSEAMEWSVLKWMWEKSAVRQTADQANAALDQLDKKIKARWSEELKTAYKDLRAETGGKAGRHHGNGHGKQLPVMDPQVRHLARRLKEADEEAYRVRMDAEQTFDEAERQLNTNMAREGCRKAIDSWVLHEKAIRMAEGAVGTAKAAS